MIRMSVNNGKEVFSSFSMLKHRRDKLMEFLITYFLKIDILIVLVFILFIPQLIVICLVFVDLKDVLVLQSLFLSSLCFNFRSLCFNFLSVFGLNLHEFTCLFLNLQTNQPINCLVIIIIPQCIKLAHIYL